MSGVRYASKTLPVWAPTPNYRFTVPPFPTGWFGILDAATLERGSVIPVRAFGRELVAWRGEDGEVRVLDAHCPHLGAHLGHGGRVEGNCVRCPFHAWRFEGDGRCVEIPYAKKIPPNARLGTWHAREKNGYVLVWFEANGAEPAWEPEEVAVSQPGSGWVNVHRATFTVRGHVQDLTENVVDSAHFQFLHGTQSPSDVRALYSDHRLSVQAEFRYGDSAEFGGVHGTLTSKLWGLGLSLQIFTGIVETALVTTSLPVDHERVDVFFSFWVKDAGQGTVDVVAEAFVAEVLRQVQNDIPIWEHKVMLDRPVLCDGDGPIGTFRRWSRRFYPDLDRDVASAAQP